MPPRADRLANQGLHPSFTVCSRGPARRGGRGRWSIQFGAFRDETLPWPPTTLFGQGGFIILQAAPASGGSVWSFLSRNPQCVRAANIVAIGRKSLIGRGSLVLSNSVIFLRRARGGRWFQMFPSLNERRHCRVYLMDRGNHRPLDRGMRREIARSLVRCARS